MEIPIEKDLKELLTYKLNCTKYRSCLDCPLHLKHMESISKANCMWVVLLHFIGSNFKRNEEIDPDETAIWIHSIATRHGKILCTDTGENCSICKLCKLKSSCFTCGAYVFEEFVEREIG